MAKKLRFLVKKKSKMYWPKISSANISRKLLLDQINGVDLFFMQTTDKY